MGKGIRVTDAELPPSQVSILLVSRGNTPGAPGASPELLKMPGSWPTAFRQGIPTRCRKQASSLTSQPSALRHAKVVAASSCERGAPLEAAATMHLAVFNRERQFIRPEGQSVCPKMMLLRHDTLG